MSVCTCAHLRVTVRLLYLELKGPARRRPSQNICVAFNSTGQCEKQQQQQQKTLTNMRTNARSNIYHKQGTAGTHTKKDIGTR